MIYIATRPEAVYVLHAFQKKTAATAKRDIDVAETRLKELIPGDQKVGWYARGVGGAAAREIKGIPAGRQTNEESNIRSAGIRQGTP